VRPIYGTLGFKRLMPVSCSLLCSLFIYDFLKISTINILFSFSALTGRWSVMETDCYLRGKYIKVYTVVRRASLLKGLRDVLYRRCLWRKILLNRSGRIHRTNVRRSCLTEHTKRSEYLVGLLDISSVKPYKTSIHLTFRDMVVGISNI
jgi:hypothetical protein